MEGEGEGAGGQLGFSEVQQTTVLPCEVALEALEHEVRPRHLVLVAQHKHLGVLFSLRRHLPTVCMV